MRKWRHRKFEILHEQNSKFLSFLSMFWERDLVVVLKYACISSRFFPCWQEKTHTVKSSALSTSLLIMNTARNLLAFRRRFSCSGTTPIRSYDFVVAGGGAGGIGTSAALKRIYGKNTTVAVIEPSQVLEIVFSFHFNVYKYNQRMVNCSLVTHKCWLSTSADC